MQANLDVATAILRGRLATRIPIGVNIIHPYTAELPKNLNDHPGRFVGYFRWVQNDMPSFVWLSRNIANFGISHVHIFYVNSKELPETKTVTKQDKTTFISKGLPPHTTFCAINVLTNFPPFMHLNALVQTLEVELLSQQLSLYPYQVLGVTTSCSFKPLSNSRALIRCFGISEDPFERHEFWPSISELKYKWIDLVYGVTEKGQSPDFDVARINLTFLGYQHFVYGIHYRCIKALMLIIPHPHMFRFENQIKDFLEWLKNLFRSYKFKFIGPIRYHGSSNVKCSDEELLRACLLALEYPMNIIKHCDIAATINEDYFTRMTSINNPESQFSSSSVAGSSHNLSSIPQVSFNGDGEGELIGHGTAYMNISDPGVSTECIDVFDPEDLRSTLDNAVSQRNVRLVEFHLHPGKVPQLEKVDHYDDVNGDYLLSMSMFDSCIHQCLSSWKSFATYKVLDTVKLDDVCSWLLGLYDEDFVIQPVLDEDGVLMVIILDNNQRKWYYLNPYFSENTAYSKMTSYISTEGLVTAALPGRAISMTSYFHQRFVKVHLLMCLYTIGGYFKYAVLMPRRVFYLERDFRQFCWIIYGTLMEVNADYNIKHGLIQANRYLQPESGGMRTVGTSVAYIPAVVSREECPFCGRRDFNNIGRHMSMAHGNQAKMARAARTEREKLDEDE